MAGSSHPFPPPGILSALVASTTTQTLMTSKSVSRNWPPQLRTNHLPDECVLIYTNPLKSAPKPMWKFLDAACVLGCLGVLKSPKGSRKFTFPSRPRSIHDYSRHSSCLQSFPPDRQSYHKRPLFFLSSLSFAMTLITSDTGNLSHHLIHFRLQQGLQQRHLPCETPGLTKQPHPILPPTPY